MCERERDDNDGRRDGVYTTVPLIIIIFPKDMTHESAVVQTAFLVGSVW